jgi:hypothetical protein
MRELVATILLVLCDGAAHAGVMRCSDATGNTLYTDAKCPDGMRSASVISLPQSCATNACELRREREVNEANERVRAEKQQLAAYTAERQQRELEYRWLDEARAEAASRQAMPAQTAADEPVYPAYPLFSVPVRCGTRCAAFASPHRRPLRGVGTVERRHHGSQGPQQRVSVPRGALEAPHTPRGKHAIMDRADGQSRAMR